MAIRLDTIIKGYQSSHALYRWGGDPTYGTSWRVSIHFVVWRREKSLRRLCKSLLRANHYSGEVALYIHVNGDALDLVLSYVLKFDWSHGLKTLNVRQEHRGMSAAPLSGWTPCEEDDMEMAIGYFESVLYCLYTL